MSDTRTPAALKTAGRLGSPGIVQSGRKLAESMLPWGHRTTDGNEVKVVFGGQTMVHARMRIDESKSPFAVDYLNLGRSGKGQISLGIMPWVGEEVLICMSSLQVIGGLPTSRATREAAARSAVGVGNRDRAHMNRIPIDGGSVPVI